MGTKQRLWAWITVMVGLILALRTGVNIFRLWKLGERVETAQKQVNQALAEKSQLEAKLKYVESNDFVEKEARDKLGYGRKGETIVVVPQDNFQTTNSNNQKGQNEANWQKWRKLYIRI